LRLQLYVYIRPKRRNSNDVFKTVASPADDVRHDLALTSDGADFN